MKRPFNLVCLLALVCFFSACATRAESTSPAVTSVPSASPAPATDMAAPATGQSITRIAVPAPDSAELAQIRRETGSYVSPWLLEVLKLSRAGVEDAVIEAFIRTAGTFNLTPNLLIYARDAGISPDVLTFMLNHDADLGKGLLPPPNAPPLTTIPRLPPLPPAALPAADQPTQLEDALAAAPEIAANQPNHFAPDIYIEPPVLDERGTPVREPYPVPLTDPIRIFRGVWRQPNVQIIWMLPGR